MNLDTEFPLSDEIIYLNHAAVSPWTQRAHDAVQKFSQENITYGASYYPQWMAIEQRLRERLQRLINAAHTDEIALVKNTSEALSFVAYGITWEEGDNIVITNQEFPSNRIVWESLAKFGVELRQANIDNTVDPETAIFKLTDKRTRLISVSAVQYASGLRLNLEKIGAFCQQQNILYCIDAIQHIGALEFDVQAYHADFAMADGHKWLLSAEGLGVFYCRQECLNLLTLHEYGWHMVEAMGNYDTPEWEIAHSARRFECGSPNMLGAYVFEASLAVLEEIGMDKVEQAVLNNTTYLIERLQTEKHFTLLSATEKDRYAGITTFTHNKIDNKALHQQLMQQGIICAQRGGGIRFSPHFYTPHQKIDAAIDAAIDAINTLSPIT